VNQSRRWLIVLALPVVFVVAAGAMRMASAVKYTPVDLKPLGNFPMDPLNGSDKDIPARFRKLDGHRVALQGSMWGGFSEQRTENFQLIYSFPHSYGGPPLVQERVFATVPNGGSVQWRGELVTVEGTLHVGILKTGQYVASVYRLDVDRVQPAALTSTNRGLFVAARIAAVLLQLILGFRWLNRLQLRRRRLSNRLCPECGYDMRASGSRCPECGKVVVDYWPNQIQI